MLDAGLERSWWRQRRYDEKLLLLAAGAELSWAARHAASVGSTTRHQHCHARSAGSLLALCLCNRTADGINLEARMMWEIWRSCITISRARKLVLSGPESSQHQLIYMVKLFIMLCKFLFLMDKHILNTILILFSCFKIQSQRQSYHRSRRQEERQDNLVLRYATY